MERERTFNPCARGSKPPGSSSSSMIRKVPKGFSEEGHAQTKNQARGRFNQTSSRFRACAPTANGPDSYYVANALLVQVRPGRRLPFPALVAKQVDAPS